MASECFETNLLDLPHDLITYIIQCITHDPSLSVQDTAGMRMSCKTLHKISNVTTVSSVIRWASPGQYRIVNGYKNVLMRCNNLFRTDFIQSHADSIENILEAQIGGGITYIQMNNMYGNLSRYAFWTHTPYLTTLIMQQSHEITDLPMMPQSLENLTLHDCQSLRAVCPSLKLCQTNIRHIDIRNIASICDNYGEFVEGATRLSRFVFHNSSSPMSANVLNQDHGGGLVFPSSMAYIDIKICSTRMRKVNLTQSLEKCHKRLKFIRILYDPLKDNDEVEDITEIVKHMKMIQHIEIKDCKLDMQMISAPHLKVLKGVQVVRLPLKNSQIPILRKVNVDYNESTIKIFSPSKTCINPNRIRTYIIERAYLDIIEEQPWKRLKHLSLKSCESINLTDLNLSECSNLRKLEIIETNFKNVILPTSLKSLSLQNNMELEKVAYEAAPLIESTNLHELTIISAPSLTNIGFIRQCKKLQSCQIKQCRSLSKLDDITDLKDLRVLHLAHLPEATFQNAFCVGNRLREISLMYMPISSMVMLSNCCKQLKRISVLSTCRTAIDLSTIGSCTGLTDIKIQAIALLSSASIARCKKARFVTLISGTPLLVFKPLKFLLPDSFLYIAKINSDGFLLHANAAEQMPNHISTIVRPIGDCDLDKEVYL